MRFDLPEDKRLVHTMVIPIRWGDMDMMGHVNNAMYFRYMEIARIEWLHAIGARPDPKWQGPVIVNAFCNFIHQLEYPGDLLVRMFVSTPGRSSFDTWLTMARTDAPDVVCATGGATTVWLDFPSGKSAPMPDWLRSAVSC
ncbi:MAG: thioesterase [Burkholderiales bacterium PBB6]|nr:MAG: thioesterase [Burkholderiales bacterium PBB6]